METIHNCMEKIAKDFYGDQVKVWVSEEAEQDFIFYNTNILSVRTSDPTDEEITDWKKYDEFLRKLDVDEAREKYHVQFLEQEKPYQDNFFGGECCQCGTLCSHALDINNNWWCAECSKSMPEEVMPLWKKMAKSL